MGKLRQGLPLHPSYRCLWLPVTKSFRELGLDIDEFKETARPWTIRKDGVIGYGGKEIEQLGHIEGRFKETGTSACRRKARRGQA